MKLWLCFSIILLLFARTYALFIAKSRLESCTNDETDLECSKKLVVAMVITAGTDGVETLDVQLENSVEDTTDDGKTKDFQTDESGDPLDSFSITLQKTELLAEYPTSYYATFNAKPYEVMVLKHADGNCFSPVEPCKDDNDDENPSCPALYDENNDKIAYSQGFCCMCDAWDMVLGPSQSYRGDLSCDPLASGCNLQSAHCMRYHDMWFYAFKVKAPSLMYSIRAVLKRCKDEECTEEILLINANESSSAISEDKTVKLDIIGDFDFAQQLVTLEHMTYFVPKLDTDCNTIDNDERRTECEMILKQRITSSSVMLIPNHMVYTSDAPAGTIGIDHKSFFNQVNRCIYDPSETYIFDNQLLDHYLDDSSEYKVWKLEEQGLVPILNDEDIPSDIGSGNIDGRLLVKVKATHNTQVSLSLTADDIRFVTNVHTGVIANVTAPEMFEQNKDTALVSAFVMDTTVCSNGNEALFKSSLTNCTDDVVIVGTNEQQFSLGCGEEKGLKFSFMVRTAVNKTEGGDYSCDVLLRDSQNEELDRRSFGFETKATEENSIGGGSGAEPIDSQYFACFDKCNKLDIMCFMDEGCYMELLSCLIIISLVLCFCFKCGIAEFLMKCICNKSKKGRRRGKSYYRGDPRFSTKKVDRRGRKLSSADRMDTIAALNVKLANQKLKNLKLKNQAKHLSTSSDSEEASTDSENSIQNEQESRISRKSKRFENRRSLSHQRKSRKSRKSRSSRRSKSGTRTPSPTNQSNGRYNDRGSIHQSNPMISAFATPNGTDRYPNTPTHYPNTPTRRSQQYPSTPTRQQQQQYANTPTQHSQQYPTTPTQYSHQQPQYPNTPTQHSQQQQQQYPSTPSNTPHVLSNALVPMSPNNNQVNHQNQENENNPQNISIKFAGGSEGGTVTLHQGVNGNNIVLEVSSPTKQSQKAGPAMNDKWDSELELEDDSDKKAALKRNQNNYIQSVRRKLLFDDIPSSSTQHENENHHHHQESPSEKAHRLKELADTHNQLLGTLVEKRARLASMKQQGQPRTPNGRSGGNRSASVSGPSQTVRAVALTPGGQMLPNVPRRTSAFTPRKAQTPANTSSNNRRGASANYQYSSNLTSSSTSVNDRNGRRGVFSNDMSFQANPMYNVQNRQSRRNPTVDPKQQQQMNPFPSSPSRRTSGRPSPKRQFSIKDIPDRNGSESGISSSASATLPNKFKGLKVATNASKRKSVGRVNQAMSTGGALNRGKPFTPKNLQTSQTPKPRQVLTTPTHVLLACEALCSKPKVYFNVKKASGKVLKLKLGKCFSIRGVLRSGVVPGMFQFQVNGENSLQIYEVKDANSELYLKLSSPRQIDSSFHNTDLTATAVSCFVTEEPQFVCVNQP